VSFRDFLLTSISVSIQWLRVDSLHCVEGDTVVWNCVKCLERVEDSFDVCWKCGTSKDGTEDPAFRGADEARDEFDDPSPFEEAITDRPRGSKSGHPGRLIVTTGNEVAGRAITGYLGVVRGIVVRSPGIGQGILGGLQQLIGGNIDSYADVCDAAREDAYQRMIQHALQKEADAVIGMRYDATEFSQGVTEVLAYGTAVKLSRS
jgi:uncharacterized protein YbjQ (UPF0145 family)